MNAHATATLETPVAPVTPVAIDAEPRQGDVVVAPEPETPGCYTLSEVPGRPSMRWISREKAADVARGFARAHAVDVWFVHGRRVARVHTFRSATRCAH